MGHLSLRRWLAIATAAAATLLFAAPAQAATGDSLRTIQAGGGNCGINVGLALVPNASNELEGAMSCYDNSRIDFFRLSDGAYVRTINPAGVGALGALAYDATRGTLWACSNFNTVVRIDPVSGAVTPGFNSSGCFDGLAYDGTDDTLWSSNDAQCPVYHYTAAGASLGSGDCSGLLGGSGNSGIAVGGTDLYLANNGGQQIYQVPKTFASSTLFHQGDRRIEDLECDNATFRTSDGVGAVWFQDAYDREVQALEIPPDLCGSGGLPPVEGPGGDPSCDDGIDNDGDGQIDNGDEGCDTSNPQSGRMTGRAWTYNGPNSYNNNKGLRVLVSGAGDTSRRGQQMNVPCEESDLGLSLEIKWGFRNNPFAHKFTATGVDSVLCTDNASYNEGNPNADHDSLVGVYEGTYQGVPGAKAELTLIDNGENASGKGTRLDRIRVKVYDADGNQLFEKANRFVGQGNVQAEGSSPAA